MGVRVRRQRVRGQVLFQGDDPCHEAGPCRGRATDGDLYGEHRGLRRGVPFRPDHLGAACGHHDIVHGVGAAVDVEGDAGRSVRVHLGAACQGDAGDDVCVHPVGVVGRLQHLLRHVPVADDADAQGGENLGVGHFPAGGAGPGRVA